MDTDVDVDMDAGSRSNDYCISTPVAPPKAQIASVLAWLQDQGAEDDVIQVIKKHHDESLKPPPASQPRDPWLELRSIKDKAKHVEHHLKIAQAKVPKVTEELEAATSLRDDLAWRHQELLDQTNTIVNSLPHVDKLKSQVQQLTQVIQQIQGKVAGGIPDGEADRKQLYRLIFNNDQGQAAKDLTPTAGGTQSSHNGDLVDGDLIDRTGFGFGIPSGPPRSLRSGSKGRSRSRAASRTRSVSANGGTMSKA